MPVMVRIPPPLLSLTQGQAEVSTGSGTVKEIIDGLESRYPGLKERLCDDGGKLRRFVNVYVDEDDIRFKDGLETLVADGSEVSIIPAVAGGS
ncbi:MAG: ubiquitin-like small modifier protein 1 [Terriglobia bacterium]